jgi:Protein  of unknown function (DUF3018)
MPTKPRDPTGSKRIADHRQRLRERGLVPVEVWIPPAQKDALKAFVRELQRSEK